MVVSLHVATGGLAGLLAGSRLRALLLGPALHVAADRVPHQDVASRRFEIVSGSFCLGLLVARRGPFDPVTLGAAASSAPDLEHVVPWLRPGGRKVFHRRRSSHFGGVPASLQLLLAGAIVGFLLGARRSSSGKYREVDRSLASTCKLSGRSTSWFFGVIRVVRQHSVPPANRE